MGGPIFHVQADWDHEAGVWVATSDDVPGLATEAPTIEALAEKLRIMIPELLEANQLLQRVDGFCNAALWGRRRDQVSAHRECCLEAGRDREAPLSTWIEELKGQPHQ